MLKRFPTSIIDGISGFVSNINGTIGYCQLISLIDFIDVTILCDGKFLDFWRKQIFWNFEYLQLFAVCSWIRFNSMLYFSAKKLSKRLKQTGRWIAFQIHYTSQKFESLLLFEVDYFNGSYLSTMDWVHGLDILQLKRLWDLVRIESVKSFHKFQIWS